MLPGNNPHCRRRQLVPASPTPGSNCCPGNPYRPSRPMGMRNAQSTRLGSKILPRGDGWAWRTVARSEMGEVVSTHRCHSPQQGLHRCSKCQRRFRCQLPPLPQTTPAASGLEKSGEVRSVNSPALGATFGSLSRGTWGVCTPVCRPIRIRISRVAQAASSGATLPRPSSQPPFNQFLLNGYRVWCCFFQARVIRGRILGCCQTVVMEIIFQC